MYHGDLEVGESVVESVKKLNNNILVRVIE